MKEERLYPLADVRVVESGPQAVPQRRHSHPPRGSPQSRASRGRPADLLLQA